jgi:hypothetical protein
MRRWGAAWRVPGTLRGAAERPPSQRAPTAREELARFGTGTDRVTARVEVPPVLLAGLGSVAGTV